LPIDVLVVSRDPEDGARVAAALQRLAHTARIEQADSREDAERLLATLRWRLLVLRYHCGERPLGGLLDAGAGDERVPTLALVDGLRPRLLERALQAGAADVVDPRAPGALECGLVRALADRRRKERSPRVPLGELALQLSRGPVTRALSELDYLRMWANVTGGATGKLGPRDLQEMLASIDTAVALLRPLVATLGDSGGGASSMSDAVADAAAILRAVIDETIAIEAGGADLPIAVACPAGVLRRVLIGAGMDAAAATSQGGAVSLRFGGDGHG